MHSNLQSPAAKKNADVGDIAVNLPPFIRKYKDGRIERFLTSSFVPASEDPAAGRGVATRDVVIDHVTGVCARLFLPFRAAATCRRLPLVMYIHGGAFCTESAFCRTYHRYASSLAATAGALLVSVEYRLAPEFPIPAAYDDAWAALRWVASMSDPWLTDYADPGRTFLAGDSAGANIAYQTAVRASSNSMDIQGLVMVHPYFWGVERLPSEAVWDGVAMFPPYRVDRLWPFVTGGKAGNDDPRINPPDEEIASLICRRRVLLAVAEKDTLGDRGRRLAASIRDDGHRNNLTVVESEGEDHGFHLYSPLRATSRKLMESIAQFINLEQSATTIAPSPSPTTVFPELHFHGWNGKTVSPQPTTIGVAPAARLLKNDVFRYGMAMKGCSNWPGPRSRKTRYGLFSGTVRPNRDPLSATISSSYGIKKLF